MPTLKQNLIQLFLQLLVDTLATQPDHVSYINAWGNDLQYYAAYLIDSYLGSMFCHGSTPSEQNHSSFSGSNGLWFGRRPCHDAEKNSPPK